MWSAVVSRVVQDGAQGLRAAVRQMMEIHWRGDLGWSVPNAEVYPWLWLWDSCFHALIWDALDDERAAQELAAVFTAQLPSGFVPHMNYAGAPGVHAGFWGVRGVSTITQPPMYGHALAVLAARGHDVERLVAPALLAARHLLESRRAPCGLLRIFHPWESGIDDHPRWTAWQPCPWERAAWRETKGQLITALKVEDGEAVASEAFDVCPAGFNALTAWNVRQLGVLAGDDRLVNEAVELAEILDKRWDAARVTWSDCTPNGRPGSAIRTVDALLPALVSPSPCRVDAALASAVDPAHYGLPYGPTGVHVDEPAFAPTSYGRGSTWPHLTYLLWRAAQQTTADGITAKLASLLVAGAHRSGLAEHWDPRDGSALGAVPQSWSGLAVVADRGDPVGGHF